MKARNCLFTLRNAFPTLPRNGVVLGCGVWLLFTTTSALAATINWSTGAAGDASGSWNGTTATFNGQAYTAADSLVINGTAGKTVTTTGVITAPALLTVSSTGATGNTTLSVPGTAAVTLTGASVGGALNKTGSTDLVLSSANAFGAVTISSGKFFLNNAAGLGTTGTVTVNSGAANGVVGSYAVANMGSFFYDSTNINADYTFSKNIAFGAVGSPTTYAMAMRGGATRTTTVSGDISGASNLTLWLDTSSGGDGTSIWSLTGNNSGFAGTMRVNRGRLFLGNANAGGTGSIFLQTPVNAGGNLLFNFAGNFATNITLGTTAGEVISTNGNNINYTGVLGGASSWVKAGAGTMTLASANTISGGTSLTGGSLNLSHSLALQNSTLTTGGGTVVFDPSVATHAFTLGGLAGSTALALQDNAGSPNAVALTVGNNNTDATYSGALSGAGSLTKIGTAVQTLSSASTYSGGTNINNGTVAIGNNTALGSGGVTVAATAQYGTTYASGGTPFLQTTVAGLNVANNITLPGTAGYYALQSGTAAGDTVTWSGKISGGGAGVVLQIDTPNGGDSTTMATLSNAANDFQGTIRLNRGRLALSNATAAGNANILLRTNVNASGNLVLNFAGNFATDISTVDAAGQVISTGANNINYTGILGGASSWVKTGAGTMTLASANTISGGTSITGGTLKLSHTLALQNSTLTTGGGAVVFDQSVATHAFTLGGLAGSAALALQDNAGIPNAVALTVGNNDADAAFSGALSGAGSLTKVGTGVQTLSSASTYSGGTTINNGTVAIGNNTALGTGGVTVAATAQYGAAYASGGTPFLATSASGLNVANNITLPAAAGYYALQSGTAAGSTVTWSGKISGGGAGVVLQIDTPNGGDSTTMATLSNAANDFQGTIRFNRGRLTLSNATAAGSATLYLQTNANASGNLLFSGPMTIANAVIIGTTANQAISTASGDVTFSGVVSNNAGNTTGGINKVGAGTLTLTNNANALTGPTTITAGTLAIGGAGQFNSSGTYAGAVSIASGAALNYGSSTNQTLSGVISGTGNLTKGTSATSTLTLAADNSFSGITTINAGTLALADGSGTLYETGAFFGAVGTSYVNINTGGTFKTWDWTHGAAFALSQLRSNYYSVNLDGGTIQFDDTFAALRAFQVGANGGTLEVTAGNTYTKQAGTTASEGIIRFTANSTLTLTGDGNGEIQDALAPAAYGSTAFAITKAGAGTWILSGASAYTGATTVNAGTLRITNQGAANSGLYSIASGAILDMQVAAGTRDMASSSTISGAGTFVKSGGGTLQWGTSAATFAMSSGALIDVQAGQLTGGGNGNEVWTTNLADLNVASGATFDGADGNVRVDALTGSGTIKSGFSGGGYTNFTFGVDNGSGTFSGVLANSLAAGNFVKTGSGTQTLAGASTYTGTTTIQGGTLQLDAGGKITGTSGVTVGNAAGSGTLLVTTNSAHTLGTGSVTLGTGATGTTGTFNMQAGAGTTVSISNNLVVGEAGVGDVNHTTASTLDIGAGAAAGDLVIGQTGFAPTNRSTYDLTAGGAVIADNIYVGRNTPSVAGQDHQLNISGTGAVVTARTDFKVGYGGRGTVNQTGVNSQVNIQGATTFTVGDAGIGVYNLNAMGGSVVDFGGAFIGVNAGNGTMNHDLGTVSIGLDLTVGSGAGSTGAYTMANNGANALSVGGNEFIGVGTGVGTFTQNGGTHTLTNLSGTGNMTIGASGQYNLAGGTLNFRDYEAGGASAWTPGAGQASTITTPTGAQFSFTGGQLQDVSTITVTDGSAFTQSGGNFYVGQIGAGPAAETTINGGFSLLGGVVRLDVFGADPTPEQCCDDVASLNDQMTVNGDLLLDSTVSLNFVAYEPDFGEALTLFCADTITLGDGFGIDGGFYRIIPTGDADHPFALQAIVPEPASVAVWTIIGLAGAAGVYRSRRRLRKGEA